MNDPDWATMVSVVEHYAGSQEVESLAKVLAHELRNSSFKNVSNNDFIQRISVNLSVLVQGLRARRPPAWDDGDKELRATGAMRARDGVTEADLARGALISQRLKMVRIAERAGSIGVPSALIVECLQLVDAWLAFQTQEMLVGHREAVLERSALQSRQRESAVQRLLQGGLSAVEVSESAGEAGLDMGQTYVVACIPSSRDKSPEELHRTLSQSGLRLTAWSPTAYLYGALYTVLADVPAAVPKLSAGVSRRYAVPELWRAFGEATRCAQTASKIGHLGFLDSSEGGVLLALTADEEVSGVLFRKYIKPVAEIGGSGEVILETVEHYLNHERSIAGTAKDMYVHSNTVRHRLRRFEDLTQCRLSSVRTLVEVWWTMHLRAGRSAVSDPTL